MKSQKTHLQSFEKLALAYCTPLTPHPTIHIKPLLVTRVCAVMWNEDNKNLTNQLINFKELIMVTVWD